MKKDASGLRASSSTERWPDMNQLDPKPQVEQSSRMKWSGGWRVLILGAVAFACSCSQPDAQRGGDVGALAESIQYGTADTSLLFKGVVGIEVPPDSSGGETARTSECTGVLVSTRHIISASHCFFENGLSSPSVGSTLTVDFAPGLAVTLATRKHSAKKSGPVAVRVPVSPQGSTNMEKDLSVFYLDSSVGPALGVPYPIAGIHGAALCGTASTNPATARGPIAAWTSVGTWNSGNVYRRNYKTDVGPWSWSGTTEGLWTTPTVYSHYGDSGGPSLLGGRICAIGSTDLMAAAIDSYENNRWLRAPLGLDSNDNFTNACGAGEADTGTGPGEPDQMATRCDNCPSVGNPDQADADGDGVGDACDNCPQVPNTDQSNGNRDAEQQSGSPILGDACDSNPLTLIANATCDESGGLLGTCGDSRVDGQQRLAQVPVVGAPINACATNETTSMDVANGNVVKTSSFIGYFGQDYRGLTRYTRCACPDSNPAVCNASPYFCTRNNVAGADPTYWMSAILTENGTRVNEAGSNLVRSLHTSVADVRHAPSSRSLAWAYWKENDVTVPPTPTGTTGVVWDGYLWSWVRAYTNGLNYPAVTDSVSNPSAAELRQGQKSVVRLTVAEKTPPFTIRVCNPVDRRFGRIPTSFRPPWVPWGEVLVDIGVNDTEPGETWIAHAFGSVDLPATKLLDARTGKALRDPNLRLVGVADAPSAWTGPKLGAIVDVGERKVLAVLSTSGQTLEADADPVSSGTPSPYALVAVASGKRQELVFFSDRNGAGVLRQSMRAVALATRSETTRTYGGDVALVNPVAGTYRAQDDSYYLLDKTSSRIRLVRVRGSMLELVTEWPLGNVYTGTYGLTTGPRGEIVITTSAPSDPLYCVAVMEPDAQDQLVGTRRFTGSQFFETPAYLGTNGSVGMSTRDANGTRAFYGRLISTATATTTSGVGTCF